MRTLATGSEAKSPSLIRKESSSHGSGNTRFARLQVVVRELFDVVGTRVGALQRGHPNGHGSAPLTRAAVHSSINEKPWDSVVGVPSTGFARSVARQPVEPAADTWESAR